MPAPVETTVRGYRTAPATERAGFGMLTSFSVTVGVARVINYVRERRRPAPRLRSWTRRAYHAPKREKVRIHHFVPGIGLTLLSGAGSILTRRRDGHEFIFSLVLGTGAGLTLDEITLLTELDNPYWTSEKLAAAQIAAAALGALTLISDFHRRGARQATQTIKDPPAAR